jgi:hypothetical protein
VEVFLFSFALILVSITFLFDFASISFYFLHILSHVYFFFNLSSVLFSLQFIATLAPLPSLSFHSINSLFLLSLSLQSIFSPKSLFFALCNLSSLSRHLFSLYFAFSLHSFSLHTLFKSFLNDLLTISSPYSSLYTRSSISPAPFPSLVHLYPISHHCLSASYFSTFSIFSSLSF